METMIDLNVTALTRLTYAPAAAILTPGGGRSSTSPRSSASPPKRCWAYRASKSYALSFGQLLQSELGERGVCIQTILPGDAASELCLFEVRENHKAGIMDECVDPTIAGDGELDDVLT